jgi:hypothetical protein
MTEDKPPEEVLTASTPPKRRDEQKQKKWYETTRGQIVLSVGGLASYLLFGIILWWVLDRYIAPETSKEKRDLVQALGLIMAGVAGAIGIYFTWRGQRITQKAQEDNQQTTQEQLRNAQDQLELTRQSQAKNQENTMQQLANAQEELRLTRQGQITERFTRAIDQLGATDNGGNPRLEIRLGGIYALERIARESGEDHWPIMEVLTAYVRQHARWDAESEEGTGASTPRLRLESVESRRSYAPNPDIRAIMTAIRRRSRSFGHGEPEPLDLRATNLRRTNLKGADLKGADLAGANLTLADLREANLKGAFLPEADLTLADLRKADLRRAVLFNANLSSANLWEADLRGADLREVFNAQLEETIGDETTQLPNHLKRPAHWSMKSNEQPEEE